jgi:hypothetical protein
VRASGEQVERAGHENAEAEGLRAQLAEKKEQLKSLQEEHNDLLIMLAENDENGSSHEGDD